MSDADLKAPVSEADPNAPVADARTAPVAVWQILEKLKGKDLADWRTAPVPGRASVDSVRLVSGGTQREACCRRGQAAALFQHGSGDVAR